MCPGVGAFPLLHEGAEGAGGALAELSEEAPEAQAHSGGLAHDQGAGQSSLPSSVTTPGTIHQQPTPSPPQAAN